MKYDTSSLLQKHLKPFTNEVPEGRQKVESIQASSGTFANEALCATTSELPEAGQLGCG